MSGVKMKKSMLFEAVVVILLILFVFILYVMVTSSTGAPNKWALPGMVGSTGDSLYGNMFTGANGMLYTVDGTNVNAIDQAGHIQWSLKVPYLLNGINVEKWMGEQAETDNGNFYIELVSADEPQVLAKEILVISPEGKLLWGKGYVGDGIPSGFSTRGGRLYAQSFDHMIVYDSNGSEVWQIDDIDPPYQQVTADDGSVYLLNGPNGHMLEAYDSNGVLKWSDSLDVYGPGVHTTNLQILDLLYNDHTVYVPVLGGLIALNEDGSEKWNKTYNKNISIFRDAPFDKDGNLYLTDGPNLFHISPDGTESTYADISYSPETFEKVSAEDGIIYKYEIVSAVSALSPGYPMHDLIEDAMTDGTMASIRDLLGNRSIYQLDTCRIDAYDMKTGDKLWNYSLPLEVHNVTIDESNYANILTDRGRIEKDNMMSPEAWYRSRNITDGTEVLNSWAFAYLMPAKGLLYVNLWSYNYEVPTFFGRSNCTYAGGVYAINRNGSLVWLKSTDARVTSMEAINGTIFYGTNNGRMSAARIDAAAGFALTAAFYLFIRFFLVGAVTRARGRINSNKNRNTVLRFIAENPGISLYDISKDLNMNMGTVRYHLMILGINHRITSYKADDKYVRYFTNAGSYTAEQQFIVSLIRRDGIRKVLGKLLENPGLSNLELAEELGMQDTSTMRYTKELLNKGILIKDRTQAGKLIYTIKNEYVEQVALAMDRLKA
jgi:predicted transcriptional regulator